MRDLVKRLTTANKKTSKQKLNHLKKIYNHKITFKRNNLTQSKNVYYSGLL